MERETHNPAGADGETAKLEADVRDAVERGLDVQEAVRRLTLLRMGSRSADLESLRAVASAVLRGARAGMQARMRQSAAQTEVTRENLKQAVAGLEAALGQFAEASKLALEEAAHRARAFSAEDLVRARADLENLERMFLDTLQSAASATKDEAGQILDDLAAHARTHGSLMRAQLKSAFEALAQQLAAQGRAQTAMGLHLMQATSDALRQIAAGVLTGVADHVKPRGPREKDG